VVSRHDRQLGPPVVEVVIERAERHVGGTLLVGLADDEVDAEVADGGGGRRLVPLVVVEPPDRGGRLGERLQRLGDPLVVVGTEVTDEQVHVVVGVREHAFERRVDGVRPGGDQPDRRLRVGVLGGVVLAITVVGLALRRRRAAP